MQSGTATESLSSHGAERRRTVTFLHGRAPEGSYRCDPLLGILVSDEITRVGLSGRRALINWAARIAVTQERSANSNGFSQRRPDDAERWQRSLAYRFFDAVLETYIRHNGAPADSDRIAVGSLASAAWLDLGFSNVPVDVEAWKEQKAKPSPPPDLPDERDEIVALVLRALASPVRGRWRSGWQRRTRSSVRDAQFCWPLFNINSEQFANRTFRRCASHQK